MRMRSKNDEKAVLEQLVADVRYTGTEMAKQQSDARYRSKKAPTRQNDLYRHAVTVPEVENFHKYIAARPAKYASNTWKFSEIMATWMDGCSPRN